MLRQLFWSNLQQFVRGHLTWRGMWRLSQWITQQQLREVQIVGNSVSAYGPLYLVNNGTIRIGDYVELRSSWHKPSSFIVVNSEAVLTIEDHAFINWGVNVGVAQSVTIGAYSQIGDDCVIYDSDWHSIDGLDQDVPTAPTVIGRGVWLGARVMVLQGVTIGNNTVVAANSVVTKSLPADVLAGGAPAKVIRSINRNRYKGL